MNIVLGKLSNNIYFVSVINDHRPFHTATPREKKNNFSLLP